MTYAELQAAIKRFIKATGGAKDDLVKDAINMVYQLELCKCDPFNPLFWLRDYDDSLFSKSPSVITAITGADPGVVTTSAAHGLVDGDIIMLHSISGMTELNGRLLQVGTVPGTTSFNLEDLDGNDIDTSGFTAYSSGGVVNHHGFKLATTGKNVDELLLCKWHGEAALSFIDITELEKSTAWMDSSTSRPSRYMHRKTFAGDGTELNQIIWFFGADTAYHLRYWFTKRVSALSADADVPIFPPQFHHAIISGVVLRLKEWMVQVEEPNIWAPLYQKEVEAIIKFNHQYYEKHSEDIKPYLL